MCSVNELSFREFLQIQNCECVYCREKFLCFCDIVTGVE